MLCAALVICLAVTLQKNRIMLAPVKKFDLEYFESPAPPTRNTARTTPPTQTQQQLPDSDDETVNIITTKPKQLQQIFVGNKEDKVDKVAKFVQNYQKQIG